MLLRKAIVIIVLMQCSAEARASLIVGTYEGFFLAILDRTIDGEHFIRDASVDGAKIFFAIDTDRLPEPDFCVDIRCSYASGVGDPSWLSMGFDFGDFKGVSIPNTATSQTFTVSNSLDDSYGMFLRSDWITTFGSASDQRMFADMFLPQDTFDDPSIFQPGSYAGSGIASRLRFRGACGLNCQYEYEYEFTARTLRIATLAAPPVWALFGIGALIALRRRAGTTASPLVV